MSELAVIVPSRGRPENIERLIQAWKDTQAEAELVVCVDEDDPKLDEYRQVCDNLNFLYVGPRKRLVPWLNAVTPYFTHYSAVGFMGDDHVVRTPFWDQIILGTLDALKTGFAYGDDLLQGRSLPTAWFMTSDIVDKLGYMIPPCLVHMYADNWVMDAGRAIGRLKYLPEVVIEHMHPMAGKTENTAQYDEVAEFMGPDEIAYNQYLQDGSFDSDVMKLKALL